MMKYDQCRLAISECVNELVAFLDVNWEHVLDFDHDGVLHPTQLARYANAIYDAGAPLRAVWGFIDCTIRRLCRPTWYQRVAYNGHKKIHALKYQAVMLPNGIVGHLNGPYEGRRADPGMLRDSGLLEHCAEHAFRNDGVERRTLQLFGDPAYSVSPFLVSPFAGAGVRTDEEKEWNTQMASVHIEVEV